MVFATSPRYYFYFKENPGKKKGLLGLAESDVQVWLYFRAVARYENLRGGGGARVNGWA